MPGYTKRQLVEAAYEELGMAKYQFDLPPEIYQQACRRLDAMMAQWEGRGIRVPYIFPDSPENTELDEEAGIPDYAHEAVYTNLAIRLAPVHGKVVSRETKKTATEALNTLEARTSKPPPQMQLPGTMPAGAGNKPWRYRQNPFIKRPCRPPALAPDEYIELE